MVSNGLERRPWSPNADGGRPPAAMLSPVRTVAQLQAHNKPRRGAGQAPDDAGVDQAASSVRVPASRRESVRACATTWSML